ncbi:RNA-binding domain-containing protein [Peniophora sp. CONT]|nr:RNA-binding domain-containing protein [Peniophora sp. CONT]
MVVSAVARLGCRLHRTLAGAASSSVVLSAKSKNALVPRLFHVSLSTQTSAVSPGEARTQHTTMIAVGPLALDTDDTRLRAVFAPCGEIVGIDVQKRFTEGELLGSGIVRFKETQSVDGALKLDGTVVGGQTVYVRPLFARPGAFVVKFLRWGVEEDQLRCVFEKCGEINHVDIRAVRHKRQRRMIGFVHFSSHESAKNAVNLTGMELGGKRITVDYSVPGLSHIIPQAMKGEPTQTTVHVRNLPPQVTEDWLIAEFQQCGEIHSAHVQRHLSTDEYVGSGNSLGYGYVKFVSAEAVDKALELDNRLTIAGQLIHVQRAPPFVRSNAPDPSLGYDDRQPNTAWVSGLTREVDDAKLWEHFERFGKVMSATVVRDRESHTSRGFGYVKFASQGVLEEALLHDSQMKIDGFTVKIRRVMKRIKSDNSMSSSPSH